MSETVFTENNLRSAVGTRQLYLHPPFLAARGRQERAVSGAESTSERETVCLHDRQRVINTIGAVMTGSSSHSS